MNKMFKKKSHNTNKSTRPKATHINQRVNKRKPASVRVAVTATIVKDFNWVDKDGNLRLGGETVVLKVGALKKDAKGNILDKVTGYNYEFRKVHIPDDRGVTATKKVKRINPDNNKIYWIDEPVNIKMVARISRQSNGITEAILDAIKDKNLKTTAIYVVYFHV